MNILVGKLKTHKRNKRTREKEYKRKRGQDKKRTRER
jgi:hypothetical protein